MADSQAALDHVEDALNQVGFKRDWSSPLPAFKGTFKCAGLAIPVTFHFEDPNFVRLPRLVIDDKDKLPKTVVPHLISQSGELCYLERTTTVLDRYNPGGTALRCLQRARDVLEDALKGKLDADLAGEFFAYWGGTAYVDLPGQFSAGDVRLHWLALTPSDPEMRTGMFAPHGKVADAFLKRHRAIGANAVPVEEKCTVLDIDQSLTVPKKATQWPPDTLREIVSWLAHFLPNSWETISQQVAEKSPGPWWVLLRAKNGNFIFKFSLPTQFQKEEFTRTRRSGLPNLLEQIAETVPIERFTGFPVDSQFVFDRSLNGMKGMQGKKILLIGCGTIGGYLAHQLAQSGAGTGAEGHLVLADNDVLQSSNLGRHLLGIPYLKMNKAEACKQFIESQIPHVRISAKPINALTMLPTLADYDFVIDGTGEEALSIALNQAGVERRSNCPSILFVWLVGNGAAAQAILTGDSNFACYKCLKPELASPPRHKILKEEARFVRNLSCGDATYVPFPVSRSVQAAGLALDMCLAWANGHPKPYFRNRTFDDQLAFHVKDSNPEPISICPACGSK